MEKRYYTVENVLAALAAFEKAYGLDSEAFYRAHVEDASTVRHVPRHHRIVWADFCRTRDRLTDDGGFASRIERELVPA